MASPRTRSPFEATYAADSVVGLQFFDNGTSQEGLFYLDGAENPPVQIPGDANGETWVDDKDASILGRALAANGRHVGGRRF